MSPIIKFLFVCLTIGVVTNVICDAENNHCVTKQDRFRCPQYGRPGCEKFHFIRDLSKPFPGCCARPECD